MKTPEEIAREIVKKWWPEIGEVKYAERRMTDAIASAIRTEREAREKAEAERDEWKEACLSG